MKKLLLIGLILTVLLCGCGEKEEEIQYAPADEKQENIFMEMPLDIPEYTHDTRVGLFDKYRVDIDIDFAGMYYDEESHTIGLLIDSSNRNKSDITIKADAIVDGNADNVVETEYEVILGEGVSVERDLKIKLNEEYQERLDSIEITFDISSSSGKKLVIAPYKIENFYSSTVENPRMITPQVTGGGVLSGSDIWLDEEIDVYDYEYEEITGRELAEVIAETEGISKEEAREQIRQQQQEETEQAAKEQRENELKAKGKKEVGNERIGYYTVPAGYEEIVSEEERIELVYEDDIEGCEIKIYLDTMDTTKDFPYFDYDSKMCQKYIDMGGKISTQGLVIDEDYGEFGLVISKLVVSNLNDEKALRVIGTLEDPIDASKVIVMECNYDLDSTVNLETATSILASFRHDYIN